MAPAMSGPVSDFTGPTTMVASGVGKQMLAIRSQSAKVLTRKRKLCVIKHQSQIEQHMEESASSSANSPNKGQAKSEAASRSTAPDMDFRSRTRSSPSPTKPTKSTKSTASSAEPKNIVYSMEQINKLMAQHAKQLAEKEKRHAEELANAKRAFDEAERRNQEKLRELEARCNANEAASQMCFHALFAATGLKTSNMGESFMQGAKNVDKEGKNQKNDEA